MTDEPKRCKTCNKNLFTAVQLDHGFCNINCANDEPKRSKMKYPKNYGQWKKIYGILCSEGLTKDSLSYAKRCVNVLQDKIKGYELFGVD